MCRGTFLTRYRQVPGKHTPESPLGSRVQPAPCRAMEINVCKNQAAFSRKGSPTRLMATVRNAEIRARFSPRAACLSGKAAWGQPGCAVPAAMLCQQPLARSTPDFWANHPNTPGTGSFHLPGSFPRSWRRSPASTSASGNASGETLHMQHLQVPNCFVLSSTWSRDKRPHRHLCALSLSSTKQRDRGQRGCHLLLKQGHAADSGSRGAGAGEGPGTHLSKISCSARWGQGEKESSELKSLQIKSQTWARAQRTQDPGSTVLLPDRET